MVIPLIFRNMNDLLIALAYFSIPMQILLSLYHYPRLHAMPFKILVLSILMTLFIFSCGLGHFLRFLQLESHISHDVINTLTMIVSVSTAVYLVPLVPSLMSLLESQIQELLQQNDEREAFIAVLAHEIRNPLFVITSAATFWEDDSSDENVKESVSAIKQSAHLILRLVNDVLDMSRLQSGKTLLEERPFVIRELLGHVSTSATLQLKSNPNVQFYCDILQEVPHCVRCDSARFVQIINNLLSNACKYTSSGSITLRVSVLESYACAVAEGKVLDKRHTINFNSANDPKTKTRNLLSLSRERSQHTVCEVISDVEMSQRGLVGMEEGDRLVVTQNDDNLANLKVLQIEVVDTGVGIPQDRIAHIFEPYTQAKLSDYRTHGGTGLGLAITSKLIDAMSGTIRVVTREGQGSTFTAFLPLTVVHRLSPLTDEIGNIPDLIDDDIGHTLDAPKDNQLLHHGIGRNVSEAVTTISYLDNQEKVNTSMIESVVPSSLPLKLSNVPMSTAPSIAAVPTNGVSQYDSAIQASSDNLVLVVDDNAMNCKLIGRMLQHFNVNYRTSYNGKEAVEELEMSRNMNPSNVSAPLYGLVFMDWQVCIMFFLKTFESSTISSGTYVDVSFFNKFVLQMPVMNGREATETIRQRLGLRTLPIVALTANVGKKYEDEALEAGVDEFASKPISRDALYEKVQLYMTCI